MRCNYCGSRQHTNWLCPKTAAGASRRLHLRCSYCGGTDHDVEACPKTYSGSAARAHHEDTVSDHFVKDAEPRGGWRIALWVSSSVIKLGITVIFVTSFYLLGRARTHWELDDRIFQAETELQALRLALKECGGDQSPSPGQRMRIDHRADQAR